LPEETNPSNGQKLFPIKVVLPPNKSRVLYFPTSIALQEWLLVFKESIGYANLFDFYDLNETLGKGQFGLVKLASHKKNSSRVAIKTVKKKDMSAIEVY
jgi:serine/threonine protein kinase